MKTFYLYFFILIFLASCNQWSEDDSIKYMDDCEKSFTKNECECQLENIKNLFTSFEELSQNEASMAKIFENCLESNQQ